MKKLGIFSVVVALLSSALSLNAQVQTGASAQCPDATTAQAVDYYLSNPYYFQCTDLKDTVDSNGEACKWNADGFIKLKEDGWSDFHWACFGSCIFDNINISTAGKYFVKVTSTAGKVNFICNGVSTPVTSSAEGFTSTVTLNAGMNTIKIGRSDDWVGVYSIELEAVCPTPAVAQSADYYLSNPYYFQCTDLKDTVDSNGEACKWNADGFIKLKEDGWSDFHWACFGSCIFDNINISTAGKYFVKVTSTAGKVNFICNGVSTPVTSSAEGFTSTVTLNAGMNTIKVGRSDDWVGVYSIELEAVCPTPAVAQSADYYLSNPYYFQCTDLKDTVDSNGEACKWNADGFIKLKEDGWSDFHWACFGSCIFDNINISTAGKYKVKVTSTAGKVNFICNGVSTPVTSSAEGFTSIVTLNAGMNTIKVGRSDDWVGVYSIEIASLCGSSEESQSVDYYLSNLYYFQCTTLKDTVDSNGDACKWNADGFIKLKDDGWSDFHWASFGSCIFDNINLSQAGKYIVKVTSTAGKVNFICNGNSTSVTSSAEGFTREVELNEGMNTIKIGRSDDWVGVYSIELQQNLIPDTTDVTLDLNGGEGGTTAIRAIYGQEMPVITVPTKTGFFFDGYEDADEVLYYDKDGKSVKNWDKNDKTDTLYAKWYDGTPTVEVDVDCPEKADAKAADYYLTHMYYALCTEWKPLTTTDSATGRKDLVYDSGSIVLVNKDGNWFKLCSDKQYVDWHWNDSCGKSSLIFDNIYVSEAGNYDIHWYQRNGGQVNLYVNGDSIALYAAGSADTLVMYRIALKAGEPNTIKIEKSNNWPQSLGITLSKSSSVIEKTLITFDKQQGTGGTDTISATKGDAMPDIEIPSRTGYVFEGYYSEITGGDQYYYPDGTSYKNWDKSDATFTLYAHWNDGSTGGDCPTPAQAISENWYFSHMYDARCTELTNTWVKDGSEYIYLNADGENIKITENGEWMDFYWADPSSIIFDSIYVSKDVVCDMEWYFRCDVIDGDNLDGSTSQIWVNDELACSHTVWISDEGIELDTTVVEGLELYSDWPNVIKIVKGNGWPLTRGIKLVGGGLGVENTSHANFFVLTQNGEIQVNRLSGESHVAVYTIAGSLVKELTTTENAVIIPAAVGSYIVSVNGEVRKAIVR